MSRLQVRVEALEGSGTYSSLGDVMDALERQGRGERVDWSTIRIDPKVAAALDLLPNDGLVVQMVR